MHKCLAIFLLLFMPLQLTWAAANTYCQHESGAAAQHFGHHNHQHQAQDDKSATPDPAQKYSGGDPDCTLCHAGYAAALTDSATIILATDSSLDAADYLTRLTAPLFKRRERPQWPALA